MEDAWEVLLVYQDGSVLQWQAVQGHGAKEVEVTSVEERKVEEGSKCLGQEEDGVQKTQEDQALSMLPTIQLQQQARSLLLEADLWVAALAGVFCLAGKSLQRHQKNEQHY
jgi:hypothetical protein